MNMAGNVWDTVSTWFKAKATHYVNEEIPLERTDLTGAADPLVPMRDYMRIWLDDMFLAKDKAWFVEQFPAVHTAIQLSYGASPVTITHVTDGAAQAGRGIFNRYALTDLIPFNGGKVSIQCALIALKGRDYASEAIGILKGFSGLVGAPFSQTLMIAEKVNSGMQSLLNKGNADVKFGFHQEYASDGGGGGSVIKPGYTALVFAEPGQIDPKRLCVEKGKLMYEKPGSPPAQLDGFDYMLLRIEGRSSRDNWRMPNIEEPLNQAIRATLEGDSTKADGCLKAALLTIWQSPDLAVQDRRRVAEAIKAELAEVAATGHGAVGEGPASLDEIMSVRAMPPEKALYEPELTLEEILHG